MAHDRESFEQVEQQLARAQSRVRQLEEENHRNQAGRTQTEQALRESQRVLATLMSNLPGMAYRCANDTDWTMEFVSDGCQPLTGYTPTDLIANKTVSYAQIIDAQDRESVWRRIQSALAQRKPFQIVYRIHAADGQRKWVWEQGCGVFDVRGELQALEGFITDITLRIETEEALRQSMQQLQMLNTTLEQRVTERTAVAEDRARQLRMLAGQLTQAEQQERRRVAHVLHERFQQLLTGARYSVSLLRRKVQDQETLQPIEDLNRAIDEAIQVSRSLTVELSPPILYDAGLSQALVWLGHYMEEHHGLNVKVQADPAAEPPDEEIRIALFLAAKELLFNVVKHAGVPHASASMTLDGEGRTRIIVTDSGAGFDPEAIGRTPSGYGLFAVRERLGMLGGRLEIQASPGHGTRATALGPLPAPAESTGENTDGEPALQPFQKKTRVLIADDHAIMRDGLVHLLETYPDIEVAGQASDGLATVELTRQLRPDVVIMDVTMPRLNGIEATRQILAAGGDIQVIGLSMHDEADMAARMRQAGAAAYLAKSGPPNDLIEAIRACRRRQ